MRKERKVTKDDLYWRKFFQKIRENADQEEVQQELAKSIAVLAAGCFWGVEEIISDAPGVLKTEVGYTGGYLENPTSEQVTTGQTGHAEAVRVFFDPKNTSYQIILEFFFRLHDPTTLNRQGPDIGTQYRSAIFYQDEKQKQVAETVLKQVAQSGKWKNPVVTQVVPFQTFYLAEEYHQKYLKKHPNAYTCQFLRN